MGKILYAQHDPAKDKPLELELSWVCDESKRWMRTERASGRLRVPARSVRMQVHWVDRYDSAASAARLIWVQLAPSGGGCPRWSPVGGGLSRCPVLPAFAQSRLFASICTIAFVCFVVL